MQCNRETPQRWLDKGPLLWAIINGLALGCGVTTRIGFWLWYAVPLGAFLVGRPELGAVIYRAYGIIRGMAAWVIFLGLEQWLQKNSAEWLLQRAETAQVIASGQLVLLA